MEHKNELGLPIGFPLPAGYKTPAKPPRTPMQGRIGRVVPLDPDRHSVELFQGIQLDKDNRNWTYLAYGPFADLKSYRAWMDKTCTGDDPLFHTVIDGATGKAVGVASYLRIDPAAGSIEVGHIHFTPAMQRGALSTECMYLMMKRAFEELGYRRYEWKCDSLNGPSNAAAKRLGFTFEGIFRQCTHYKGRNRDTAWYSILDREWPAVKKAFETWLDPSNFDAAGKQKQSLSALTGKALGTK